MKDLKYDAGKPRPSLILKSMSRALLEVSKVATFGAEKYAEDSWLTVKDGEKRYRDAKDRHMLQGAFETVDSESGISHLAHEAWNALALLELSLRGETIDIPREAINGAAFDTGIPVSAAFGPNWPESAEVRSAQIMQNGNEGEHYRETLNQVIGDTKLRSWVHWVAVDEDGEVYGYSDRPYLINNRVGTWAAPVGANWNWIKDIEPPLDFTKCIWEIIEPQDV